MRLFENSPIFHELIETASSETGFSVAQIEKDYYISLLLSELAKRLPNLLFKGGTSLSKCHKAINRFSEDIDLTLDQHHQSQGERRKVKYAILDACTTLGFEVLNISETKSRRDYNCYDIKYPLNYPAGDLRPIIKAETVFIQKAYPDEIRPVTSILHDFLEARRNGDFLASYPELEPFLIRVQTLERTFVDKVFALCDYMMGNNIARNSRHIYDLYCLWPRIKVDEELKLLVRDVRTDRKANSRCYSAQDGANVNELLSEIISSGVYKDDYENITKAMIYQGKYIPYEEAMTILPKIIAEGLFDFEE